MDATPTEAQLRALVGKNVDYYIEAWGPLLAESTKLWTRFNLAAFFWPEYWLLYRKMWRETITLYGCDLVIGVLYLFFWDASWLLTVAVDIPTRVLLGLCGNALYFRSAMRTRNRIMRLDSDEPLLSGELRRQGGVSSWAVPIGIGIRILLHAVMK